MQDIITIGNTPATKPAMFVCAECTVLLQLMLLLTLHCWSS